MTFLDKFNYLDFMNYIKKNSQANDFPKFFIGLAKTIRVDNDYNEPSLEFIFIDKDKDDLLGYSDEFGNIVFIGDNPRRTEPYKCRILAMYLAEANRGVVINGKSYSEAYLDNALSVLQENYHAETNRISNMARELRRIEKQQPAPQPGEE